MLGRVRAFALYLCAASSEGIEMGIDAGCRETTGVRLKLIEFAAQHEARLQLDFDLGMELELDDEACIGVGCFLFMLEIFL